MKTIKVLSIVSVVIAAGILGFVIYSHFKNKADNAADSTNARIADDVEGALV